MYFLFDLNNSAKTWGQRGSLEVWRLASVETEDRKPLKFLNVKTNDLKICLTLKAEDVLTKPEFGGLDSLLERSYC